MNRYQTIKKIAVLSAELLEEVQFDTQIKKDIEDQLFELCWTTLCVSQKPEDILKKMTNHLKMIENKDLV